MTKFVTFKNGKRYGINWIWYPPTVNNCKQLAHVCHYNNNDRYGQMLQWDQNGTLREVTTYVNGERHGLFIKYNEQGNKILEINYINDMKCGLETHYHNVSQSQIQSQYVEKAINYHNGHKHGIETYDGENGKTISYYEYDSLKKTQSYYTGKQHNEVDYNETHVRRKYWYESGCVELEHNGKRHGEYKEWYDSSDDSNSE